LLQDNGKIERWTPFRCVARPHRDELWLQVEGEIDLSTAPALARSLAEALAAGFARVVLDLNRAGSLDSSGLSAILDAHASAREQDVGFAVRPGPPGVRRIFELTGTTYVLFS
jgi:anti-sigma B factor antagonist